MDRSTIAGGGGFPDLGLDGAVIVVTGAGSGIGAATALRLGAAGAHVVLVGRRSEPLELSARCGAGRGRPVPLCGGRPVKGRKHRSNRRRGGQPFRDRGRVGEQRRDRPPCAVGEWKVEGFDEHVAVNLRAPFFLTRDALPFLQASPIRSVVNVSSSSGTLRLIGQSVYGTTKSALELPHPVTGG